MIDCILIHNIFIYVIQAEVIGILHVGIFQCLHFIQILSSNNDSSEQYFWWIILVSFFPPDHINTELHLT